MACYRSRARHFVVLAILVALGLLPGGRPIAAAENKDKPKKSDAAPDAKKKDDKKKKQAELKKKREDAMKQAMEAYERQRREEKERLLKDPMWQPAYEPANVIKVNQAGERLVANGFCLNREGNLLVCCGTERRPQRPTKKSSDKPTEKPAPGKILVLSPKGERLAAWPVSIPAEAICAADDGSIYVAGKGKALKLDAHGGLQLETKVRPPKEKAADDPDKKKKIAALTEQLKKAQKKLQELEKQAAKIPPKDEKAAEALDDKAEALQQDVWKLQEKLGALQPSKTPPRPAMATGIAVDGQDVFIATSSSKGYGFVVWRTDRDLKGAKQIIDGLAGCCGQMDVQARHGELWVAHNAKHKVEHYDRDGKRLSDFGKTDRIAADGFGGCCEPKNLRVAPNGDLFTSESGPPTCVKRFSPQGKFLGVMAMAPWDSGCVRVTTEYCAASDRLFVLNTGNNTIQVFTKKAGKPAKPAVAKR